MTQKRKWPQLCREDFVHGLTAASGPTAWRNWERGWTRTVGRWRLVEKPMRAISWSRQKRYLPHPWGLIPNVRSPISQGAGRLASPAQAPAVLEAGQEALGQFGPAREVEGVDTGRQLPQPCLGKMRICD